MSNFTVCEIPTLRPQAALDAGQRDEMFALLTQHFDGVHRAQFELDLAEKNWVIALRRGGRLVGFSTLLVIATTFESSPILAIYSGDTIVAPEARGSPGLARAWIAAVNRLREDYPGWRCYWLLLTSGFRTYRFLPVFWREFFPRAETPTPPAMQRLLGQLAQQRYGSRFDAAAGLVRFPQPQRLRGALAGIPDGRTRDADVAFFLARNPGHAGGDELVCLTEISAANLTAAGRRMVGPGGL
jgi:hypothetical protein